MEAVNFIPTRRPQDELKKGVGVIKEVQGNILRGEGGSFTKSLGEKFTIGLTSQKVSLIVSRVIDDATVQIENPENFKLEAANEPYTIMPKIDQKETFGATWQLLHEGKVVGIFPEVRAH